MRRSLLLLACLAGLVSKPSHGAPGPTSLTFGDYDGDGKIDIAYSIKSTGRVGMLPGKGDGTFGAPKVLTLGRKSVDKLVCGPGRSLLALEGDQVLLWDPERQSRSFPTGTHLPAHIALGDVDGDGLPDAVGLSEHKIAVLPGLGDGFGPPRLTTLPDSAGFSLSLGDINGDGKLDIVVPFPFSASDNKAMNLFLLNRGNGTFESRRQPAGFVEYVCLADCNGDGKLDLVWTEIYSLHVSAGNGDGTFQAPRVLPLSPKSIFQCIATADFNRDGLADIVTVEFTTNKVVVALGDRKGLLVNPTFLAGGPEPWNMAVGDLNGDGNPDIAVANMSSSLITVLLGKGEGTFVSPVSYNVDPNRL